jgi:signal transduction histidine kinase
VTHPFGYVLKPFEDREIEVAIQTALYRHKMEQALRESERRLDAILASIGDAVIATDTSKRVTFLNRAAETLLGWRSERARGRLLSDVLKAVSRGDGALGLPRVGGDMIPIELVESPVLDAGGAPTGYVTVVRDVSERLRAQAAHDRELIERAARLAAEKERERARLKGEISLALGDITDSPDQTPALRRVAYLIASSFGDWCVMLVADGDGSRRITAHAELEKVALAEEIARRWTALSDAPCRSAAVIRTGQAEWRFDLPDEALVQTAQGPAHLEALRKMAITSFVCVPMRARQRTVGALSCLWSDANHRYDESDLAFAQQIADRIALAIDNARLYREAHDAREAAEWLYEAEQRARTEAEALFRVADALTEVRLDLGMVVQRVTDEATALVGAKFGAFLYNAAGDSGRAYMHATLSGAPWPAFDEPGMPWNPLFEPTFAGTGVVRLDDVRNDPRLGEIAPRDGAAEGHPPVTSYLAVPVVSRTGPAIGGLFFGHPEPGQFTEQHERMARALAAHAAVAIDNARLFKATREAQERQARLVADLERAVRFSEMFVGILGHDLRNPLSGITTAASLVLSRADSDRIATPVSRILNSAARMSRMIDQILDMTHVRFGGGIPLIRRTVDLADVCRLVLDELKSDNDDGMDTRVEIGGQTVGIWDEDRLAQMISNLAGNALQHRQPGTQVLVSIDGSRADRVEMAIENEGTIPPEILPIIFEPLRAGEPRKREGSSGLGLGLYITQQIIAAHGGSIRVDSGGDGRTRFTVELPRTPRTGPEHVFGTSGEGE